MSKKQELTALLQLAYEHQWRIGAKFGTATDSVSIKEIEDELAEADRNYEDINAQLQLCILEAK